MNLADEIQKALHDTIQETGCLAQVAAHCAHTFGWGGNLRVWKARVSQWGNTRDPHRYPAEAIPIIRMCSGRDPFTSIILRAAITEPEPLPERIEQQLRQVR